MTDLHLRQGDLIADLMQMHEKVKVLPPTPLAILTHHSVPYGRAFRQWDTRGHLWVWANRGQIEDMPRIHKDPFAAAPIAAFGMPKDCPTCGAKAGESCRKANGRGIAWPPHKARLREIEQEIEDKMLGPRRPRGFGEYDR